MSKLIRTIHPEIKVIDAVKGTVEYIASDESIDSYGEVVHAAGVDFSRFKKNAPFVDSHNYESIDCLLGKVVDYSVKGDSVVETVQYAIDVPECVLANFAFKMVEAGYIKAVSIGFLPTKTVSRFSRGDDWDEAIKDLGMGDLEDSIRCIYMAWTQLELSQCCIGANQNAVAKSFKAGLLSESDLEKISALQAKRELAPSPGRGAEDDGARLRQRAAKLLDLQLKIANAL